MARCATWRFPLAARGAPPKARWERLKSMKCRWRTRASTQTTVADCAVTGADCGTASGYIFTGVCSEDNQNRAATKPYPAATRATSRSAALRVPPSHSRPLPDRNPNPNPLARCRLTRPGLAIPTKTQTPASSLVWGLGEPKRTAPSLGSGTKNAAQTIGRSAGPLPTSPLAAKARPEPVVAAASGEGQICGGKNDGGETRLEACPTGTCSE
jgi:hypothetical protein